MPRQWGLVLDDALRTGMDRSGPRGTLELALMADRVPPDEVYETLSTPAGLDRAFDKLASIADVIVWWTAAGKPRKLLATDQVAMTTAYNGRIQTAINEAGAAMTIIWEHQIIDYQIWAVVNGTPHMQAAMDFIRFATTAKRQAEFARLIPYGPARASAMKLLSEEVVSTLPTAPAHMQSALMTNHQWWAKHQAEIAERFQAFVEQSGAGGTGDIGPEGGRGFLY